jgi:uncharacterized protein (TIGR02145 family)
MKKNETLNHVLYVLLILSILISCKKEALKTAPVVSVTSASAITANSASSGGNVSADGGATVTSRGVCWSTGSDPTTSDSKTSDGNGLGNFTSSITGLTPGTNYTLKAYALNSVGTSYSSPTSFSTLGTPATVTTSALSGISFSTAISGGNVTSDGGSAVSVRGVCWSTNQNPDITNNKTSDGNGTGSYISTLPGLLANTTYYVRAYATNNITTVYGTQLTFTTLTTLATLTTTALANINAISATGGGNISNDGGATVTSRGVCWSTNQNPDITNNKTSDGSGSGSFTSSIIGLSPGITYYFRAYATNSNGTSYGPQITSTTSSIPPTLTTVAASSITSVSAVSGGANINDGGAAITAKGVCWSTSQNPITADFKSSDGTGTGSFTSNISGLTPGKTYYVRAYATNSIGTGYGIQLTITAASVGPTLSATTTVSNITATSASSGGNITSDGGATVTARGVCWRTSQNPTISDSKTTDGADSGSFTSSITGLNPGTTYYFRAYAINVNGPSYGLQVTATTAAILPSLTTATSSSVTSISAVSGGTNINDGGAPITAKGVCWSTSQNPTTANSKSSDGSGTGNFTSSISGLTPGTTYYIRAYATNGIGTGYGPQIIISASTVLSTLTTTTVSNISATSVSCGGNITNDGGATVTARGVCWSINQNPTIVDSKTMDGYDSGSFTSSIIGLSPGKTYYFRAYATNVNGTSYGLQVTATTTAILPTLTTATASSVTYISAVSGGTNINDGGAPITAKGVCLSTSQNPTTSDLKSADGTGSGSFVSNIGGLAPGVTYYIRAYATNSIGTGYGTQVIITTSILPASLTTATISSITAISATGGGIISSDGGAAVTVRGVCWSTSQSPTISDSKTTDGGGISTFNSNITGLNGNTTYYVRAYAINSQGTAYGNEVNFKTSLVLSPAICTTSTPSSITSSSALMGGNVSSDGNATVTERGVCYSTSPTPTINNNKVGVGTGNGTFYTTISGLVSNTTYYVRAYAINSQGIAYGNELNFKTNIVFSVASITTSVPISVTANSVVLGGNITSDGNVTVTERGVCYATYQNPTINSPKITLGNGIGSFNSSVSGLSPNTAYYVRAYAINGQGTAYGIQMIFTTASLPSVTTSAISSFSSNSATCGGVVINDGGAPITSRGVCWSTNQSPTVANMYSSNGSGLGLFTINLNGLLPNTTYFVRSYATNSNGTGYGNQLTFTTDPITVSDIDGNAYKVARIGTQLWMTENLKTTTYNDGSLIPMVSGRSQWTDLYNSGAYCWYNNDNSYKNTYGALYNMYAVETFKVCPIGWHVSTLDDWSTLLTYLDYNVAGGRLKETGTSHWISPNTGATNDVGFTALPGGYRSGVDAYYSNGGIFEEIGTLGYWWSPALSWTGNYYNSYDFTNLENISITSYTAHFNNYARNFGFSVRCVKN